MATSKIGKHDLDEELIADITDLLNELDKKAGLKVEGKTYTIDGVSVTAGIGAEIFNNYSNRATGEYSHAEGVGTTASGDWSHAEGDRTTASEWGSHAEGRGTDAIGEASHAEGYNTTASGTASHAEGNNTIASAEYSHAEGRYTTASSKYQHVQGKYNIDDAEEKYAHIVGNGEFKASGNILSNAHTLDWEGNAWFQGSIKLGGTGQDDTTAKSVLTSDYIIAGTTDLEAGVSALPAGHIYLVLELE